jgi:hypothetical protein
MSTSERNPSLGPSLSARAVTVRMFGASLGVTLEDGRSVSVPMAWFPRLVAGTPEQLNNWRIIGRGVGIHWPDLDEDISVENLLAVDGQLLMDRSVAKPGVKTKSPAALVAQVERDEALLREITRGAKPTPPPPNP